MEYVVAWVVGVIGLAAIVMIVMRVYRFMDLQRDDEPAWPSDSAGSQSPYGEDHEFPLPTEKLRYDHPTSRPKDIEGGSAG